MNHSIHNCVIRHIYLAYYIKLKISEISIVHKNVLCRNGMTIVKSFIFKRREAKSFDRSIYKTKF